MAQIHTLTFTNKTRFCASKKRVTLTFLTLCLFLGIVGICAYQIAYGKSGSSWKPPLELREPNFRLPKNLKPIYYKLDLIPHLSAEENFRIDGRVAIDLVCNLATNEIVLNVKDIRIREVRVHEIDLDAEHGSRNVTRELVVIAHEIDPKTDFYRVKVNETLHLSTGYRITIGYEGTLNDELVGFYRSSYVDAKSNQTRWMGVSQFSPTDARRAFPSFDEPAFKAVFEVSLARRENMKTISNMELVKTEKMEDTNLTGWVWDHYNKSLPMSTYLVGFAVTDFESRLSNQTLSRPKFQVWARGDAIGQTEYAGNIGPKILTYFEQYFGIEFPLPKLDMIGVPEHRFNAMENWGLITYREIAILFDSNYSSDANKRGIAEVVSHELGHQWFGNLVTPAWWSDLWLKEGFASFMEYHGVNFVEPDWKMLDLFVLNEIQSVFRLDALNNSHPISIPVGHPDEINEIFDDISYSKGCTIIRMMDHFLTSPTFKQGITNYLNKWAYNNTEQSDLWRELTLQGHSDGTLDPTLTIQVIMDTWTLQKGLPVITTQRNYDDPSEVTFTQKKFSLIPEHETSDLHWYIPVSVANGSTADFNDTSPKCWISPNETMVTKTLDLDPSDWYIINVQTSGYYRVNYDETNWKRLTTQLMEGHEVIHQVNRGQLLDDALTLARASLLTYDLALNLTLYISNETDFLPWQSYFDNMQHLFNMALNSDANDDLQAHVNSLLGPQYDRLGFDENSAQETVLERAHRIHILEWACELEYSDCIEKSVKLFDDWMNNVNNSNENRIPVNLRPVVYCAAIRNGTDREWEFAKAKYLEVGVASEKDRILSALACSKDETILKKYISDAVTPNSFVRKQDSRNVLQRVASKSYLGNRLVFEFLQKEWLRIKDYFGAGLSLSRLINKGIAPKLKTAEDLAAIEKFRADYSGHFGAGERAVDEAVEIVKTNLYWMTKSFQTVVDWLKLNQPV